MSSIPISDFILTIGKVGAEVGQDLMPLFEKHEPRLRTEPLPPVDETMLDDRAAALHRADVKRDTDPAPAGEDDGA